MSGVILSWGYFVLGTFCLGDILSWGRFVLWTFCLVDILSWGRFVLGTFCPWGHFVRGRFVLGTFCLGDNLSWGQSVKGTFCLGTLCPQGHFLHGDILYMGTFCPVTIYYPPHLTVMITNNLLVRTQKQRPSREGNVKEQTWSIIFSRVLSRPRKGVFFDVVLDRRPKNL